jgi:hypothetical protein
VAENCRELEEIEMLFLISIKDDIKSLGSNI